MKESDIQGLLSKWLTENWHSSAAFELKLCKGKSLPFDQVKDHQLDALAQVKDNGLFHKINDMPIFKGHKTRFTSPKPFDCFILKGHAYVVICFYEPHKKKRAHFIDVDEFIDLKHMSKRRSLTEEEAEKSSVLSLDL